MSLLNSPSDGIHSIMIVIFNLLVSSKKPLTRKNIIKLCAPGAVGSDGQVRNTLNTWISFGLFTVNEPKDSDSAVLINSKIKKNERTIENLPHLARQAVLSAENNSDLWAGEGARGADFTRAVSWLLAQDVWTTSFEGWPGAQTLFQGQLGQGSKLIPNGACWKPLKAWARYFGFAWFPRYPAHGVMIDPTRAIRNALPEIFGKKKELRATDFLATLSHRIPVLDGGSYRIEVEDKLLESTGPDAWRPPPAQQLSTSLSRAILRLTADGSLNGELRDDSPQRITLTGQGLAPAGEFSHFTKA